MMKSKKKIEKDIDLAFTFALLLIAINITYMGMMI